MSKVVRSLQYPVLIANIMMTGITFQINLRYKYPHFTMQRINVPQISVGSKLTLCKD